MLASMGIDTGVDIDALLALRQQVQVGFPEKRCTARCGAPDCPEHSLPAPIARWPDPHLD